MTTHSTRRPPSPAEACQRVLADRPAFHGYGEMRWDVSTGTLEHLAGLLRPGVRTLEIGLGVSTVICGANPGGTHAAIGPAPHEFERIAAYCRSIGVSLDSTTYLHGPSDRVLPQLTGEY